MSTTNSTAADAIARAETALADALPVVMSAFAAYGVEFEADTLLWPPPGATLRDAPQVRLAGARAGIWSARESLAEARRVATSDEWADYPTRDELAREWAESASAGVDRALKTALYALRLHPTERRWTSDKLDAVVEYE